MEEETFIKPKSNIELGANLDALSIDELSEYIAELENEIKKIRSFRFSKKLF